jgi:hypothetical protein
LSRDASHSPPLDRRANIRAPFHLSARFVRDPSRPLQFGTGRAVTQDISLRGLQILSPALPSEDKSFDIWIHFSENVVVRGCARLVWARVEDTLADSSYWLRAGFTLNLPSPRDRRIWARAIAGKTGSDRVALEEAESKVGYSL